MYTAFDKSERDGECDSQFLSMVQNDIPFIYESYFRGVIEIFLSSSQIIVYAFFLFRIDYKILLLIIILSTVSLFLPRFTARELSSRKTSHLDAVGKCLN